MDQALDQLPPELASQYRAAVQKSSPRPFSWGDVIGNRRAVEQIQEAIAASKVMQRPLPHLLLFGPPGTGKSTMAKLIAREFGGAFLETMASTLETPADMIRLLWQMNKGKERTGQPSTIFIDEIHQLGQAKGRQSIDQESVFPLLEDWKFPHNMIRKKMEIEDGRVVVLISNEYLVWPFSCVGATTEPGMLSQPLLRRFLVHVELEPYSEAEITQIIIGSAKRLEWVITEPAAETLAKYGRRTPGTALQLLTSANSRAVATGRTTIDQGVADEVIERMRLYPLGLTETDVRVLRLLYDRIPKGVGMGEICRALGISQSQFTGMIEPYLRLLGMIETLARRVIRPEGVRYLAQLGEVDTNRPEIRAALA